jgi:1-acyl-sn-glycerol-3-phosphate acyltransferase
MKNIILQRLFFALVARPILAIVVGMNVRHKTRLPKSGPAILAANHNSHLDTVALMTIFPARLLPKLRPVAAADYFFKNRWLAWFSQNIMGILPMERHSAKKSVECLEKISEILENQSIVIFFPEGSRGEPEQMAEFKSGIAHLARRHPDVPVIPIFMHGLGKTLPKGEYVPVPFFCDVFVGKPIYGKTSRQDFMAAFQKSMRKLSEEGNFAAWK